MKVLIYSKVIGWHFQETIRLYRCTLKQGDIYGDNYFQDESDHMIHPVHEETHNGPEARHNKFNPRDANKGILLSHECTDSSNKIITKPVVARPQPNHALLVLRYYFNLKRKISREA